MSPINQRVEEIKRRVVDVIEPQGVELGVFQGAMSQELLKAMPTLRLWMVDSWKGTEQQPQHYRDCGDYHAKLSKEEQDGCRRNAERVVANFPHRAAIAHCDSIEAANTFEDRFLDFVFIDSDHSYEGCKRDIEGWQPKIKLGGWLCGHDYDLPGFPKFGVKRAVDEAVAANNWKLELGANYTWFAKL